MPYSSVSYHGFRTVATKNFKETKLGTEPSQLRTCKRSFCELKIDKANSDGVLRYNETTSKPKIVIFPPIDNNTPFVHYKIHKNVPNHEIEQNEENEEKWVKSLLFILRCF